MAIKARKEDTSMTRTAQQKQQFLNNAKKDLQALWNITGKGIELANIIQQLKELEI